METDNFSLLQVQNWMQSMLVPGTPSINDAAVVDEVVNPSKRLTAAKHLNIYRHSYIARLRACMQSQFGALSYALGDKLFELFADQYLDAFPSKNYTLNTLGKNFPAFLEQTRPDAGMEQKETWPDFMIELAGFEYALSEIFDEKAAENSAYPTVATPDELLKPFPVLRLFHHRFPVCNYYLEFSQGKKPELPFPEESFCAVSRREYKLGLFAIRGAQYYFLKIMMEGRSVSEAKDELVSTFHFDSNEMEKIWPEWKRNFIGFGFFCA